jgi:hypothetical protein
MNFIPFTAVTQISLYSAVFPVSVKYRDRESSRSRRRLRCCAETQDIKPFERLIFSVFF